MPKPEFEPTEKERSQVKAMAAYGVPQDDIALVIGVAPKTLRKHFRNELDVAMAEANARVAESLFKQATEGNTAAAIFWLKARAGWRETQNVEHSGKIEGASDEERIDRLTALFEAARDRRDRSSSD